MTLTNEIMPERNERSEAWSVQLLLGSPRSPPSPCQLQIVDSGRLLDLKLLSCLGYIDLHLDAMMSRED